MNHPIFPPRFIGFDGLSDLFDRISVETPKAFPPYNVVRLDDGKTAVEMAVAGFSEADLTIQHEGDRLRVSGQTDGALTERTYLHQGIARRAFQREFALAPHMVVSGASLSNGILSITLEKVVPEALQPRTIAIQTGHTTPQVEATAIAGAQDA
jgi:molecular chaperone IbpA